MFNSSLISKKIDLAANDGLSFYHGQAAQQHHDVYEVMFNFFNKVKPKNILEIGTALGGFTTIMYQFSRHFNNEATLLSYDVHRHPWYDDLIAKGIDIRVENVFSDNYTIVKPEVIEYIQRPGTSIVFCDGGWKRGEFDILSNYIKQGDFILAHDYSYDKQTFEEKIDHKIWNWFEISNDDIKASCERNSLIDYDKEIFQNVVWTCRQKI